MKRTILFLALLLSSLGAFAYDFSAVAPSGHTLYYNIVANNNVEVTYPGLYPMSPYSNFTIPEGSLIIPENVTYEGEVYSVVGIGNNSFTNCKRLAEVSIPNSVVSIGVEAFAADSYLFSVTIPNSVVSVGRNAFVGVKNIVVSRDLATSPGSGFPWGAVWINGYIEGDLIYGDASKALLTGCRASATAVNIPNSVTTIRNQAFVECSYLTNLVIPNSVSSIGPSAFGGCISLTSINLPNNLTSIASGTFTNCTSLVNITIPSSVSSIGDNAFGNCEGLTSITIPNSVTQIGNNAFANCKSLFSVTIPGSVTSIGYDAFRDVTHVAYNGSANGSPWGATYANKYLVGDLLYENVTRTSILRCRKSSTNVTIPNTVTSIASSAFSGCYSLTSVTIPSTVTSIGSNAFSGVRNIVYNGGATGSPWGALSVNGYVDGIFVYSDYTKTNLIGCGASAVNVTIPSSVITIGNGAFSNCSNLTSVIIPNSVNSIGNEAFYDCSNLTSVIIPNSVTTIGYSAFWTCRSLESVTIPNSVMTIDAYTFYGCSGLTSVTIPNSVTSIGYLAFSGCRQLSTVYDYSNLPITRGYVGIPQSTRIVKVLTDDRGDFNAPSSYNVDEVTYTRNYEQGNRSTLCLPFKPTAVSVQGLKFYKFTDFDGSTITYDEVAFEDLRANRPYMVEWPASAKSEFVFSATNATIPATPNSMDTTINGGSFIGTMTRECMNSSNYGYKNGYFVQSADGTQEDPADHAHVNPFRAYFEITTPSGSQGFAMPAELSVRFNTAEDNVGIDSVEPQQSNIRYSNDVYDMMGRMVRKNAESLDGLRKGVYIWKGEKKVVF